MPRAPPLEPLDLFVVPARECVNDPSQQPDGDLLVVDVASGPAAAGGGQRDCLLPVNGLAYKRRDLPEIPELRLPAFAAPLESAGVSPERLARMVGAGDPVRHRHA
ncbi:MAG: hypothetical protein ACRDJ9_16170 [Dehalococcoidia bacterium]